MSVIAPWLLALAVASPAPSAASNITACSVVTPSGKRLAFGIRHEAAVTQIVVGGALNATERSIEVRKSGQTYSFAQDGAKYEVTVGEVPDERGNVEATLSGTPDRSYPMIMAFGFCSSQQTPSSGLSTFEMPDLFQRSDWPDHCFALVANRLIKAEYRAPDNGAWYQDAELSRLTLKRTPIPLSAWPFGSVVPHLAGVGNKEGQGQVEAATYDAATGDAVVVVRLTKDADSRLTASRYVICGSKNVKVGS